MKFRKSDRNTDPIVMENSQDDIHNNIILYNFVEKRIFYAKKLPTTRLYKFMVMNIKTIDIVLNVQVFF